MIRGEGWDRQEDRVDSLEVVLTGINWWGTREANGVVRLEPDQLILEVQTRVLGLIQTGLKEVTIPLSEIAAISFEYRLVHSLITLRVRSLKALVDLPGNQSASLKLKVKGWKSRQSARAFVAEVDYYRALSQTSDPQPWTPDPTQFPTQYRSDIATEK